MAQAKSGDKVKVHYTGKLTDGRVFDTSADRDPVELIIGQEQTIPDFEQAFIGMSPGESKKFTINSGNAFGPHREDLVQNINSEDISSELELEVGQKLEATNPDGQKIVVTVTAVNESGVTIDANHPLAGEDLTFEVQLIDIV